MIRTSKHKIHDITNLSKINYLDKLFIDYKICLEYYIELILTNKLPLKNKLSSKLLPELNIKHSKYKRDIYIKASEIIKSQLKQANKRRYNKYKYIYKYYKNNGRQINFINKRFNELNLKNIINSKYYTKPNLKNISINLTSELFNIKNSNHFDSFINIKLPYFNNIGTRAIQINIPIKQHRHSNKLIENDFKLRNNIQIKCINNKYYINLIWFKEKLPIKIIGNSKGIDLGYKKLIVSSDNEFLGINMLNIYNKISNKKQGSKAFNKSLTERDNLINFYVNQLNLKNINKIIIENLKDVKKNKKYFTNKIQRWSYSKTIEKINRLCLESGIELVKVSPIYTSQTCSNCGHIDKLSRNGETYHCVSCNYKIDADLNAAINIYNRGIYSSSN